MPSATLGSPLIKHDATPGWTKAGQKAAHDSDIRSGPRGAMTGLAGGDVAARLPAPAARKLRALRNEYEELNTLSQADMEQLQGIILDRTKVQHRIDALTNPYAALRSGGDGSTYAEDHNSVVTARAEIDRLNAKYEALQERQKAREPRRNAIGNLLHLIDSYLTALPGGTAVASFVMDPPQLLPGEQPGDAVERLRQKRRELLVDLKATATAPIHSSIVKAKLRKQVAEIAERGIPDVYRLIEGGSGVRFAQTNEIFQVHGFVPGVEGVPAIVARANGSIPDAIGLIAFLLKDRLLEALDAEVDDAATDDAALSDEERAARSAEIAAELLAVERLEEAFCELSAGAVIRRGDLDPRAFLCIDGPAPRGDLR